MPKDTGGAGDEDDGPVVVVRMPVDYGEFAAPGEEGRAQAIEARRCELEVIARMLERHHGFDLERARDVVWRQPGVQHWLLFARGRPRKAHLVRAANVADMTLSSGKEVRWDVVHRGFVALNEPQESRPVEYRGKRSSEPRDSEDWQRAVRRIRNSLRAKAKKLALSVAPSKENRAIGRHVASD